MDSARPSPGPAAAGGTPRNVLANWAGMAVRLAVGLLLTPFIVGRLGSQGFGLWLLVGSFVGYFDLADLGVRSALIRFAARARARGDEAGLREIVRRAMGAATGAAGAAFLGFAVLGHLLRDFLETGSGESGATVRALVLLVGANLMVSFGVAFFSGAVAGARRYDLTNAVGIGVSLARVAMIVLALRAGWGILGLAGAGLAASALQALLLWRVARRLYPGIRFLPLVPAGEVTRDLVRYGLSSVLLNVAVRIVYYTDNVVVAAFLTKGAVAAFGIPATLIGFLRRTVLSMTNVLTPVASEMDARDDTGALRTLLLRGTGLSLVLAAPVLATFFLDQGRFLLLWVGPEFTASAPVLRILALGQLVALPQLAASSVLYAMNRHRFNAWLAMGEAAANLGLSILLVRTIGLNGVAWGTTIPLLVTQVFLLPPYVCRLLGMRTGELFRRGYVPALGAGLLYAVLFRGLLGLFDPAGFVSYFACVGAALLPYGIVVFAFVLDADLRRRLPWKGGLRGS